jgi:hypothetical protein
LAVLIMLRDTYTRSTTDCYHVDAEARRYAVMAYDRVVHSALTSGSSARQAISSADAPSLEVTPRVWRSESELSRQK